MNRIKKQELPEKVKKLNGDSADKLRKCIDDLNEAVETVKEQRRNGK
jgi:hypothetical protein